MKKAPQAGLFLLPAKWQPILHRLDFGSLWAFLAHAGYVAYFLTFSQGFEAVALDFGEVSEQVVAACIWSDEAKAFCIIEPLNGTGFHFVFLLKKRKNLGEMPVSEIIKKGPDETMEYRF
jgi:hypothetical protein